MPDDSYDSDTGASDDERTRGDPERSDDWEPADEGEPPDVTGTSDDVRPTADTEASDEVRPTDGTEATYETGASRTDAGTSPTDAGTSRTDTGTSRTATGADASIGATPRDGVGSDNTYVNALLGALVSVVLSFLPFSPALGGAVAGYLERRDGLRVGAVSGVFASLPLFGVVVLLGFVALGLGFADFALGGFLLFVLGVFAVLFVVVYAVVLSALGGLVGVYLAEEFGDAGGRRTAEPTR